MIMIIMINIPTYTVRWNNGLMNYPWEKCESNI